MRRIWQDSKHKRSCNAQSLVITIFLSIILIQAIVTCGATPLAYSSTALAVSHVTCVNPESPTNEITSPPAIPNPPTPGLVVINEILTFPRSQCNCTSPNNDTFNRKNAWVEIYNPQDEPLDLYHASIDQGPNTDSYILPFGSIIAAHGFLVIFPFWYPQSSAYTQISSVRLLFTPQIVIDQVSIPPLASETSYARIPDGSPNWQVTATPTIASSNQPLTGTGQTGGDTSTHNQKTKQKSTKTHSGSVSSDEASTDTSNPGVQPTWSVLHLPSSESKNLITGNTVLHSTSSSPVSSSTSTDSFDLPKRILLTLPIILFFFVLL